VLDGSKRARFRAEGANDALCYIRLLRLAGFLSAVIKRPLSWPGDTLFVVAVRCTKNNLCVNP
jgi:hypothetical protein